MLYAYTSSWFLILFRQWLDRGHIDQTALLVLADHFMDQSSLFLSNSMLKDVAGIPGKLFFLALLLIFLNLNDNIIFIYLQVGSSLSHGIPSVLDLCGILWKSHSSLSVNSLLYLKLWLIFQHSLVHTFTEK